MAKIDPVKCVVKGCEAEATHRVIALSLMPLLMCESHGQKAAEISSLQGHDADLRPIKPPQEEQDKPPAV